MDMFLNWQIWVITIIGGAIGIYITKYFDKIFTKISKSYKAKMELRSDEEKKIAEKMLSRIDLYLELQNDILYEKIEKRLALIFAFIVLGLAPVWKSIIPELPILFMIVFLVIMCLFYVLLLIAQMRMRRFRRIQNYYKSLKAKVEAQVKLLNAELYTSKSKPVSTDLFKEKDD